MDEADRLPPEDAVSVTADGLLRKLTLQEGTGEVPPKHARCLVHYVGRIAATGEEFLNTRDDNRNEEPEQLVAGRDTAFQEAGLHLVVATMRCGEKCRIWAAPKYGYGERGNFSFPTVPPNADLIYELELLQFEEADEGKELAAMTFEERMEAAERRRQDGNALFQQQQYGEAMSKYRLSLSYLTEELLMQLGDFHMQLAQGVKRPVLLNIAACQLREADYHAAVATCSEVLVEDPHNAKALFRRGKARHMLGQSEAALKDLEAAIAAAPSDGGIVKELAAVRKEVKEERAAAGQVFKGYFDKAKTAGDVLYDEPQPPVTPEASHAGEADPIFQRHKAEAPSASYLGRGWLRMAGAVALLALGACWCWAAVQHRQEDPLLF